MNRNDIDRLLDACQAEAARGDPDAAPGAIYFNSALWVQMSMADLPKTCVSASIGIRYLAQHSLRFGRRLASRKRSRPQASPS